MAAAPSRRSRPVPPSLRDTSTGWNAAVPFIVLLVALSYAPYASQRATVEAALARERSRHALLVSQVALRVEEEGGHLAGTLRRLSRNLGDLGLHDPLVDREIGSTWDVLQEFHQVDGLRYERFEDGSVEARGLVAPDLPDTGAAEGLSDRVRQMPDRPLTTVFSGPFGLHLGVATAVQGARGDLQGSVVATVDLHSLIERLFQSGSQDGGVSFTVLTDRGDVLLHSGLSQMPAEATRTRCAHCHADLVVRERPIAGPGDGTVTIEGVERVVAYAPVRIGSELWTISASTPVSEVLRPVAQQTIISLFFTFAVVILLLLLGVMLRRGHIRQIRLQDKLAAKEKLLELALEQERLQKELEASRRMALVGEMVARVAHEVKNPLQYIGTAVDLLGTLSRDPTSQELVADMRTGIRTLDAIVKELLDFTRPMHLDRTPANLNDLAAEVLARVLPPDVEGRLQLSPDLPAVEVDPYKIRQVLENLVRNAVEALPGEPGRCPPDPARRRVTLATEALREGPCAGGARIRVEDTGCGIAEDDLGRMWDPFWTTKTRGSGLGLPVVRRIVEAHGGEVRARSRQGNGTTFEVDLPPSPPAAPAAAPP